ncbi:helix-turn-helix domain-containing protein [Acrocarpospora corrugata]|nr:helix-turn-helix transcriptional regulator [Acrocarpospora corrugata]
MADRVGQQKKRGSGGRTTPGIVPPDPLSVDPVMRPWAEFTRLIHDELYAVGDPATRLSQSELGRKANISRAHMSNIFAGRAYTWQTCRALVAALGGDPAEWESRHRMTEERVRQGAVDLAGLIPLPGAGSATESAREIRDWDSRRGRRWRGLTRWLRALTRRGEGGSDESREGTLHRTISAAAKIVRRAEADYYLTPRFSVLADAPVASRRKRSIRRAGWKREPPRPRTIRELYAASGKSLMLIAQPGLGKSTQLAKLARHLAAEALAASQAGHRHQLPVLLDLATYRKSERLEDWIATAAHRQRGVAEARARLLLAEDALLPILDGLDTVPEADREECVTQLRRFQEKCTGLVVSCRTADEELARRVGALLSVELAAPTTDDVQNYLLADQAALTDVKAALDDDESLWELFLSPLMLKIIHRTYAGRTAPELKVSADLRTRTELIFDAYVKRMLTEGPESRYRPEQTLTWLTWLARTLSGRGEQIFHLDRVGVDWLPKRGHTLFAILDGSFAPTFVTLLTCLWLMAADRMGVLDTDFAQAGQVVLIGAIMTVAVAIGSRGGFADQDEKGGYLWMFGWIAGGALLCGQVAPDVRWSDSGVRVLCLVYLWVAVASLEGTFRSAHVPVEQIRWTLRPRMTIAPSQRFFALGVIPLAVIGAQAVLFGYVFSLLLPGGLWFAATLLLVLIYGLGDNIEPSLRDKRPRPNEGTRRSARFAFLLGSANAIAVALTILLLFWIAAPGTPPDRLWLAVGLFAPLYGVLRAVRFGGMAAALHWIIRLIMVIRGGTPLRYQRFLHHAEQCILLHSTGNGFVFPHSLFQQYLNTPARDLTARLGLLSDSR